MGTRLTSLGLLVTILMAGPLRSVSACGPFFELPRYTHPYYPDRPFEPFFAGNLGILQPTWGRAYLLVAYRYLTDRPLTEAEREVLLDQRGGRVRPRQPSALERWLEARSRVAGAPPLETFRIHRESPSTGSYYLNCTDSAFERAVESLAALPGDATAGEQRRWLAAQDMVFSNCVGGEAIPAPPDSSFSEAARRDRQYQIAAALFYAGRFADARARFEAIASDRSSRWSTLAPYLAARTLIRQATLSVPEWGQFDRQLMQQAHDRLRAVLASDRLAECHAAARALLSFVRIRLEPEAVLEELAEKLSQPATDPERFGQDVIDFLVLTGRSTASNHSMVRWIRGIRGGDVKALKAAWRQDPSAASILAVATHIAANDPDAAEIAVALAGMTDGPASLSAIYHRARLLAATDRDGARALLTSALALDLLPPSAANALLALRMKGAATLTEFADDAQRHPTEVPWSSDHQPETPVEHRGYLRAPSPSLDSDAAITVSRHLPLDSLALLAEQADWSDRLLVELTRALWVKSVLLERWSLARRAAALLQERDENFESGLPEFLAAEEPAAAAFEAALVMLRHPGLHPYVPAGPLRGTPVGELHSLRDNWWCSLHPDATISTFNHFALKTQVGVVLQRLYGTEIPSPAFLDASQRQVAEGEWRLLGELGSAPGWMAGVVLNYAAVQPSDPRLAEALHLAVRATRFGCNDESTGDYSRRAFQLLHRRFPDTEWAKKTPYWYK